MEKVTTRVSEKRSMKTKGIARFSTWEHKQYGQQLDMALNITDLLLTWAIQPYLPRAPDKKEAGWFTQQNLTQREAAPP